MKGVRNVNKSLNSLRIKTQMKTPKETRQPQINAYDHTAIGPKSSMASNPTMGKSTSQGFYKQNSSNSKVELTMNSTFHSLNKQASENVLNIKNAYDAAFSTANNSLV